MNRRPIGILLLASANVGLAIFLMFKLVGGSFEQISFFGMVVAQNVLPTLVFAIIGLAVYIAIGFMRGTQGAWYAYLATVTVFYASKLVSDLVAINAEKQNLAGNRYYREQASTMLNNSLTSMAITDMIILGFALFLAVYVYRQKRYFGISGASLSMPAEVSDIASTAKKSIISAKTGISAANELTVDNYKKKVYLSAGVALAGVIAAVGIFFLIDLIKIPTEIAVIVSIGTLIIAVVLAGYLSVWQASISTAFSVFTGFILAAFVIEQRFDSEGVTGLAFCLFILTISTYFGGRRIKKKIGKSGLMPILLSNIGLVLGFLITTLILMKLQGK